MGPRTTQEQILDAIRANTSAAISPPREILISDTTEHVGPFRSIVAFQDAAVDVSECDMTFIEDVVDFTIPQGVTIFGTYASIALDSGQVLAYYV
jgi:hypothetical protein